MNILIVNPHGIGDVLFTTPMISNLRRAYPDAKITYLANRRTSEFLKHDPNISDILTYERDEFVAVYAKNPFKFAQKWMSFANTIRDGYYHMAFDMSLNSTLSFILLASYVPRRIGFDYKGRGRFHTDRIPLENYEGKHIVEYYLDLLRICNIPIVDKELKLHVPNDVMERAKTLLKAVGITGQKPLIAVIPGGGASWGSEAVCKRWPAPKYAELLDKIIANFDADIILMGDQKDLELSKEVAAHSSFPIYSLVGKTSILEMAAILKQCRFAVANDGGPLHVAVASGIPTTSIFGPVDPVVYGPYPPQRHTVAVQKLACRPCYKRFRMARCSHIKCLNDLTVDDVYRKVEQLV